MVSHRADESFRHGRRLVDCGRFREALSFLRVALDEDREQNGRDTQARYLSYYGLCLSVTRTDFRAGLRFCRQATEMEGYCPMIWWNLGRVAFLIGRRQVASRAFLQALALEPEHRGIRRDLEHIGIRRQPVLSFLARDNPFNVCLGRLRARAKGRVPASEIRPDSLVSKTADRASDGRVTVDGPQPRAVA